NASTGCDGPSPWPKAPGHEPGAPGTSGPTGAAGGSGAAEADRPPFLADDVPRPDRPGTGKGNP
ncbi:MAG TPA: hypothetical protein VIZ43_18895, partial [Trebonia sp.]